MAHHLSVYVHATKLLYLASHEFLNFLTEKCVFGARFLCIISCQPLNVLSFISS